MGFLYKEAEAKEIYLVKVIQFRSDCLWVQCIGHPLELKVELEM